MPTGYTSKLYDLEPQTFEQYAASCSRAFGANILLRDEAPTDTFVDPVPHEPTFYETMEAEALERLERALYMTPAEAAVAAIEARAEWAKHQIKSAATSMRRRAAYEAMLAKVDDWSAPTDEHLEFAEFMRQQLESFIKFDCGRDPWHTYGDRPATNGQEYRQREVEAATRQVERAREQQAEEAERNAKRREWVTRLAESVGAVPDFEA
jgi:hypothetical protein